MAITFLNIIKLLKQLRLITREQSSSITSESTFYHVTDKGVNAYSKWVKDFLNSTRFTYKLGENKETCRYHNECLLLV